MTTKTRKLAKQAAGSVICDGQPLTVIDRAAITARRVEVSCKRCGQVREIDVTPAVRLAIDEVERGVLGLPEGDWRVTLNFGYDGAVLSAQLVRG
jgi:hypothetical protein